MVRVFKRKINEVGEGKLIKIVQLNAIMQEFGFGGYIVYTANHSMDEVEIETNIENLDLDGVLAKSNKIIFLMEEIYAKAFELNYKVKELPKRDKKFANTIVNKIRNILEQQEEVIPRMKRSGGDAEWMEI